MIKFTPGPWYIDHARPDGYVSEQIVVRASRPVYATTDIVAVINGPEANARLIAAAPELLEALKELEFAAGKVMLARTKLSASVREITVWGQLSMALRKTAKAIAKAEQTFAESPASDPHGK